MACRRSSIDDASVDSEFWFFAAWYGVAGVTMLRAARSPEREAAAVRLVASGWAAAALGRLASLRGSGRPHAMYLALTAAEVAIPVLLIRWLRTVANNSEVGAG